jgi:hypothetical protein
MRTNLAVITLSLFMALHVNAAEDPDGDEAPLRNWPVSFDRVVRAPAAERFRPIFSAVPSMPSHFITIVPCRLVDTRLANGPYGGPSFVADSSRAFIIPANPCNVPLAAAYSLNITATRYQARGFVTAYPTGSTVPGTSTLNFGTPPNPPALPPSVANAAIVPADVNGSISIYAFSATDIVIDINGYFAEGVVTKVTATSPLTASGVGEVTLGITPNGIGSTLLGPNAVTTGAIAPGTITAAKIADGEVVKSVNGLKDAVTITGINGASVTTTGNTVQVSAAQGLPSGAVILGLAGDTTLVNAGFTEAGSTDQQMWSPTSSVNAPSMRIGHTAVWTGTKMIIWGGRVNPNGPQFQDGALYDPATNSWTPTRNDATTPTGRELHTAVWTGTKMIVWGGQGPNGNTYQNSGGLYDPSNDTWAATASVLATTLTPRINHTAVWTGTYMVVWGGYNLVANTSLANGGRYDPVQNLWFPVSTTNEPLPRDLAVAVWTGSTMIIWGGRPVPASSNSFANTGGRYDPNADSWDPTAMQTVGAPSARRSHTGVVSANNMIVWGGRSAAGAENTGATYLAGTNTWVATPTFGAPTPRFLHSAIITSSSDMIVWGGFDGAAPLGTGAILRASDNTWVPLVMPGAPSPRLGHTAVWTGNRMIIWGGDNSTNRLDTGGEWGFLSVYRKN